MNTVAKRCQKEESAKFNYASIRLYREAKTIKLILFFLSMIPIILSLIPTINAIPNLTFIATMISFLLNIIAELGSTLIANHKEKAVLLQQLYETSITGTTFSKIEYDRELTNELNELAIRKAIPVMQKLDKYKNVSVPTDIDEEYTYLYICRTNSASTKYLLSRMFYIYILALIGVILFFIGLAFLKSDTKEFLLLIIQFYPLVIPVIRNINSCLKSMRYCSKIDADIDNFFADGDDSVGRIARFHYYVQNVEFEMLVACPSKYWIFPFLFKHGMYVLTLGVTQRFQQAVEELKKKAIMARGVTIKTSKKEILTKKEIDLEALKKKESKLKKTKQASKAKSSTTKK